ncbi:MAG TPA: hypothetical protein VFW73_00925 [Lacipirellulaceae bacterium]|nr:hypothetical protein [Lacipirellulaceae bacterium]
MTPITVTTKANFRLGRKGRKHLQTGVTPSPPVEPGRVPRVARMMALTLRYDGLTRGGTITDQAVLARLGHVSRARVTQIMNLLRLAPDIQEEVLFLPRIERGKEPIQEHELCKIAAVLDRRKQRKLWKGSV